MKKLFLYSFVCVLAFTVFVGSCKEESAKTVPIPKITVTVTGFDTTNTEITFSGMDILIKIPAYDAAWNATDLTRLNVRFAVQYGVLKNYDNDAFLDFSSPVSVLITDYQNKSYTYTVKVEVGASQNLGFAIQGVTVVGTTLQDADVVINGQNITVKVPTLTDNFTANNLQSLPISYIIQNGTTDNFTNGAPRDYSNPSGVAVHFKDFGNNDIVYNVKVETYFADKGSQIDPILTYTAINLNWQNVTTTYSLSTGLELYFVNDFKPGSATDKVSGYYAKLDLSASSQYELGVAYTTGAVQNIKNFYTNAINPKPSIITNGGFFGGSTSYSLVIDNAVKKFDNISTINRSLNGTSTPYKVTRSAFGILPNGSAEIKWVYNASGKTYAFEKPVRNAIGFAPMPDPMGIAYAGIRTEWTPKIAIGGAPILVKDGELVCTQTAEFGDQFTGNRSRTAIGITTDNKIILLVLDEAPAPVKGWSLEDLARIMKTLGCRDALNLDGGGSTAMVVNGNIVNRPSDTASEGDSRAVPTVALIKLK